jgi:hypothetical protein
MQYAEVDLLVDSIAILALREIEDNGSEQHRHRCPSCRRVWWCQREVCFVDSVELCWQIVCIANVTQCNVGQMTAYNMALQEHINTRGDNVYDDQY